MDIREIQRLHEQFAHAPLTLEAPTSSHHTAARMLPPPAYAAAEATRRWAERPGSARLIVTAFVGIVAAGALGMSVATWQHGRASTAATQQSAVPSPVQATAQEKESAPAPAVVAAVGDAAPVPASSRPIEPAAKVAEPAQPTVPPAAPIAAPMPRSQPSPAPAAREAIPVARKAEPAPAIAKAAPASPTPRRSDSASEIKLF